MAQYCYYNSNGTNELKKCINFNGSTYRKVAVTLSNMTKTLTISTWYSGICQNGVYTVSTISSSYSAKPQKTHFRYDFTHSEKFKDGSPSNVYTYSYTESHSKMLSTWTPMAYNSSSRTYITRQGYPDELTAYETGHLSTPAVTVTYPPEAVTYIYSTKGYTDLTFSYTASNVSADSQFAASNFANWYNIFNNPKHGVTNYPTSTISCYLQGYLQWNHIYTMTF